METKNNVFEVSDAMVQIAAKKAAGAINGSNGFETTVPVGTNYAGVATGNIRLIDFTYKRGDNAGKAGFMTLAEINYNGKIETVSVKESELPLFNKDNAVYFDVEIPANSTTKRLKLGVQPDASALNVGAAKGAKKGKKEVATA